MLDPSGTPTLCCAATISDAFAALRYTRWLTRLGASVIDATPVFVAWIVWDVVAIGSASTDCVTYDNGGVSCTATHSSAGAVAAVLVVLFTVSYVAWNFGYRQGRTGSSFGKSVMGFRVLSERTWQPVGFGASVLRQVVHLVDAVCCGIGFLFPLWDAKRQTVADKLMGTVCVPVR